MGIGGVAVFGGGGKEGKSDNRRTGLLVAQEGFDGLQLQMGFDSGKSDNIMGDLE